MERGVIASPGIILPVENGFHMKRGISPEELRYYVMYWDKVLIPGNNLVYISIPEEDEFIECGAIERPRIEFQGAYQGDQITRAILSCQSIVAKALVKENDIDWVTHQIGPESVFPIGFNQRKNILRVELANTLPVPDADTPLHELLEFKERRRDELNCLHETLDDFYLEILKSPDEDLTSKKIIAVLGDAINNIEKVSTEKFKSRNKFDISVMINLNPVKIFKGAASGALVDMYTNGLTFPILTTVGAVLSAVNIQAKATTTFQPAANNLKLGYLSRAHREGLLVSRSTAYGPSNQ